MQSRQTRGSRDRGIGRYSLSLARAMMEIGDRHEFLVVANAELGALEDVRRDFGLESWSKELKVFSALSRTGSDRPENVWRRQASELLREAYLSSLGIDFVHTTSIFEGFNDASCASIHSGPGQALQAVTLYDLIPLVFRDTYLAWPEARAWYFERLGHLRRADLLLAISEFSARDSIAHLGLEDSIVVNISGAADPHFAPMPIGEAERAEVLSRYGLDRFLMYTGGIDHRKNVDSLIRAYAQLPAALLEQVQLAIVCKVGPADRTQLDQLVRSLGLPKGRVVVTGFVPEADLVMLCNMCDAFVFPSWYEGFGLPVLEAMQCGAAVIAADASSLPEVVGRKDALFDPFDIGAISAKMRQVLEDRDFREALQAHGVARARTFTWRESARRALEAMEEAHARKAPRPRSCSLPERHDGRPALAFVSPLPPERSGIADYSRDLVPFLARHYRITLINVAGETDDPYLRVNMPVRTVDWLRRHADRFDRVVYQFGNSTFHSHMFDLLDEFPGAVVLHDVWLSGIAAHLELSGESPGFFDEHLYAAHGWPALIDRRELGDDAAILEFPASRAVVDGATGVIVHSRRAQELLREHYGEAAATRSGFIPLVRIVPAGVDGAAALARLGYPPGTRLLCAFGFAHETKYSLEVVQAFLGSSVAVDPQVRLVLVGEIVGGEHSGFGASLLQLVASSAGKVIVTGFVEQGDYALYLQAAEAAVQLRRGSRGETSAAALDCLANGVALLVNENPAFSEIPGTAVQVLPAEFDVERLAGALEQLMEQSPRRDARIAAGLDYLSSHCSPLKIADDYRDAIELFHATSPRLAMARLCKSLADLDTGVVPGPDDISAAARAMRRNMPLRTPPAVFVDSSIAERTPTADLLSVVRQAAERVELVAYDSLEFRNARNRMSSLLGIPTGLQDLPLPAATDTTYILDIERLLTVAGGGNAFGALLGKLDAVNATVWFWCAPGPQLPSLGVLDAVMGVASGLLVAEGPGRQALIERIELALASSGRGWVDVREVSSADLPGMLAAVNGGTTNSIRVRPASARVWRSDHPEVGSEVGSLQDDVRSSKGEAGFLMYGPYAAMPAGRYRLDIYGTLVDGQQAQAWYDAASGSGRDRWLQQTPLREVRPGVLAEAELELKNAVADLEIRVWVGALDQVSLHGFSLSPVQPI